MAQASQISSAPLEKTSVENIPTTSNGTEEQVDSSVKIDINAIWNESIEASKSPSPAVARVNGEDKFSEWLKQELQQAEQDEKKNETSEAKVLAVLAASESKLKPPAPARRRKKTGQEEETEEAGGAVRPNRRSRVEDSNPEEPVALAPKSPVAVARKSRRSPLPPSPAPSTSKADIASFIEQSSELDDQEARVELMMIIQAFILEKRGKL